MIGGLLNTLASPGRKAWLIAGAIAALAAAAMVAAVAAYSYRAGHQAAANSADARETKAALARTRAALAATQAALQQRAAQIAADDAGAVRLATTTKAQAAAAQAITRRIAHAPLLVPQFCPDPSEFVRRGSSPPEALASGAPAVPLGVLPAADPAGGSLTRAAVGLWNAALFVGEPGAPELGADPCATADAASPACSPGIAASASGLSLTDAWANHTTNAALCAADRARFAELIAAVQRRQGAQAQSAAASEPAR